MDYTYPSIYFSYLFFALMVVLAAFFLVKTIRDGYWGKNGEDVKFHVFADEAQILSPAAPNRAATARERERGGASASCACSSKDNNRRAS